MSSQQSRAVTLAVANTKGGVTKTSTTLGLATALALKGDRVLVVDNDPQNPAVTIVMLTDDEVELELSDATTVLQLYRQPGVSLDHIRRRALLSFTAPGGAGATQLAQAAERYRWVDGRAARLDLIPCTRRLSYQARTWYRQFDNDKRSFEDTFLLLDRALEAARAEYDYILIDTPPALPADSLPMANALHAADGVLFPMIGSRPSVQAAIFDLQMVDFINESRARGRAPLVPLGVVIQRYDSAKASHRNTRSQSTNSATLAPQMLNTIVPDDPAFEDGQEIGLPIQLYRPFSLVTQAYNDLAQEVIARVHERILAAVN